jgi:hypothetical protein
MAIAVLAGSVAVLVAARWPTGYDSSLRTFAAILGIVGALRGKTRSPLLSRGAKGITLYLGRGSRMTTGVFRDLKAA